MAKKKYIETPEILWQHFKAYSDQVKANPFKVKDWVGKDAFDVEREKEKPLTLEGFELYCYENDIINDVGDYFSDKNGKYTEFSTICSHIRKTIRNDQISGGMAGIYNPSITQRLNNLVEKVANTDSEGKDKPDVFVLGKVNKVKV